MIYKVAFYFLSFFLLPLFRAFHSSSLSLSLIVFPFFGLGLSLSFILSVTRFTHLSQRFFYLSLSPFSTIISYLFFLCVSLFFPLVSTIFAPSFPPSLIAVIILFLLSTTFSTLLAHNFIVISRLYQHSCKSPLHSLFFSSLFVFLL